MTATAPVVIDPLPPPPLPTDTPSQFDSKAFALIGALPTLVTQINETGVYVSEQAVDAGESAQAAASSATDANAAANAAAASANVSKWVTGATYAEGDVVWSPLTYHSYRRKTAGTGSVDPSLDAAHWEPQYTPPLPTSVSLSYTGRQVTSITEDGVTTTLTYDDKGRLLTATYPHGIKTRTETYAYNSNGTMSGVTATEV